MGRLPGSQLPPTFAPRGSFSSLETMRAGGTDGRGESGPEVMAAA